MHRTPILANVMLAAMAMMRMAVIVRHTTGLERADDDGDDE